MRLITHRDIINNFWALRKVGCCLGLSPENLSCQRMPSQLCGRPMQSLNVLFHRVLKYYLKTFLSLNPVGVTGARPSVELKGLKCYFSWHKVKSKVKVHSD